MNRMSVFLVCSTFLGLSWLAHPVQAEQTGPAGAATRVKLEVRGGDEIRAAMYSTIAQGFQASETVELVTTDPQWTIKVVTLLPRDGEGNATALGLSVVVLEHGPQMNMLRVLVQAWHYIIKAGLLQKDQPLEVGMRKLVAGIDRLPQTDDLTTLAQHRMCLIAPEQLGEACHDIVRDFNARLLHPSSADHSRADEHPSPSRAAMVSR